MGVWDASYVLEIVIIVLKCIFPDVQRCFLSSHFAFYFSLPFISQGTYSLVS